MYKDKDKQRQANKEAARRHRAKGMTDEGSTKPSVIPKTIKDCTGQVHQIDYEGRRKTYAVLKAWAEGKGTQAQCVLGRLAMTYNVIKRPAGMTTEQWTARYLGLT